MESKSWVKECQLSLGNKMRLLVDLFFTRVFNCRSPEGECSGCFFSYSFCLLCQTLFFPVFLVIFVSIFYPSPFLSFLRPLYLFFPDRRRMNQWRKSSSRSASSLLNLAFFWLNDRSAERSQCSKGIEKEKKKRKEDISSSSLRPLLLLLLLLLLSLWLWPYFFRPSLPKESPRSIARAYSYPASSRGSQLSSWILFVFPLADSYTYRGAS